MKENIGLGKFQQEKWNRIQYLPIFSEYLPQRTLLQKNLAGEINLFVSYFIVIII